MRIWEMRPSTNVEEIHTGHHERVDYCEDDVCLVSDVGKCNRRDPSKTYKRWKLAGPQRNTHITTIKLNICHP